LAPAAEALEEDPDPPPQPLKASAPEKIRIAQMFLPDFILMTLVSEPIHPTPVTLFSTPVP
jgi:hypothetical protein